MNFIIETRCIFIFNLSFVIFLSNKTARAMTIQLRVAVCSTELVFSNLPQNSVTPQYAYYVGIRFVTSLRLFL
jgi:hypothetical protein